MTEKVGRNDPCICGSGKKFKKCCIGLEKISQQKPAKTIPSSHGILTTTTGEPILPARLYYEVLNKPALINALKKVKCIDVLDNKSFSIQYEFEAKKSGFPKSYNEMSAQLQKGTAIILANCCMVSDKILHIDMNSAARVSMMITFVDKYIPKNIAKITHVATYNKMFTSNEYEEASRTIKYDKFDKLFAENNITEYDSEQLVKEMTDNIKAEFEESDTQEVRSQKIKDYLYNYKGEDIPLVEKSPVHFYSEGVAQLELILNVRIKVAYEHAMGNKNYSTRDFFREIVNKK